MASHSHLRNVLIVLLALTLLFARMGNAHLHLCFDGVEPASSVHIFDADFHDQNMWDMAAMSAPHHDLNISLVTHALSKVSKLTLENLALLVAILVLFGLLALDQFKPLTAYRSQHLTTPKYLRPPLRGPPSHSLA